MPYKVTSNSKTPKSSKINPRTKAIELAVFVDDELYDKTTEDYGSKVATIEEFVFAYLNAVQLLYQSDKLKTKLKIVLVRLEVLTSPAWDMNKHGGKIEAYLDSFCAWQKKKNPGINLLSPDRQDPDHWDHGLMLTGKITAYIDCLKSREVSNFPLLYWAETVSTKQTACAAKS